MPLIFITLSLKVVCLIDLVVNYVKSLHVIHINEASICNIHFQSWCFFIQSFFFIKVGCPWLRPFAFDNGNSCCVHYYRKDDLTSRLQLTDPVTACFRDEYEACSVAASGGTCKDSDGAEGNKSWNRVAQFRSKRDSQFSHLRIEPVD